MLRWFFAVLAVLAVTACSGRRAEAPDAALERGSMPSPRPPLAQPVNGLEEPDGAPPPPLAPERARESEQKMREEPPPDEVTEPRDVPPEEREGAPGEGAPGQAGPAHPGRHEAPLADGD